jgi:hypothetical protein
VSLEGVPPAPDARLDPWQIVALLGAGGMGKVHRARNTRLRSAGCFGGALRHVAG